MLTKLLSNRAFDTGRLPSQGESGQGKNTDYTFPPSAQEYSHTLASPYAIVARRGTLTTVPAYTDALQHDCRLYLLHVMKCIIVHCTARREGCILTVELTTKCA